MELPRGIRRRNQGYLVDVSYKGRRVTATCYTLQEATVRQQEIRAELRRTDRKPKAVKEVIASKYWLLGKAVEVTRSSHWAGMRSELTAALNSQILLDYFGTNCPLSKINAVAIDRFVAHCMEQGNSDATINRKLSCLRKVMQVAHDRGGCPVIPKVPKRKEYQGRVRFLDAGEEAALVGLLRRWSRDEEADAVVVLIDTGMRYGEFTSITRRDIDTQQGLISVWVNKGDLPRSVPMTARVREVVEKRIALTTNATDRLFPYPKGWLRKVWDRAADILGLGEDKQFVPHALRHTCASRLVQRGVPLKVVQEWLGHKDITTTMRYAHLSPRNLLEAVHALEPEGSNQSPTIKPQGLKAKDGQTVSPTKRRVRVRPVRRA
ncbi:MAG TPA: site-specific integrase [Humidesulfovibrio sp.]|uniref:tyrosine-type recombinase/integrase n=1 Tax=Humidesulfovibrio sp. TaxID=2910988 RepID=UPI002C16B3B4|nr:site-specific integrase [Humidesulfovibrio sp.]HWR03795.1 site-specific integrase [Humidesulfovibrio sp.]